MSEKLQAALSRHHWVEACEFHELNEAEVLREVLERVKGRPTILLDLDSTLYEVAPRTRWILQEWVDSTESAPFEEVRAALRTVQLEDIGYSIRDTLTRLNLNPEQDPQVRKAHRALKQFWRERFFISEYIPHDRPYPQAAEFVRQLHALGAELIYLTGRDEPGAGEGTRRNLIRDGFPWETDRTRLMMKEALEVDDLDHKVRAAHQVRQEGQVVASFENEPLNLTALHEILPSAMHVFVDTVCSDRPAAPRKGLYRIRGFE